ncbi:hypothetical protein RRG08_048393 [Elysia crispata]|uniref:Uncharacterized protein n=1 Tax=Elysia crispata TaxID=231223 RepID=A0AAE1BA73_9GAST|nr:hypothetical protein RRG08_048393 [Elysia crispata]
MSHLILSRHTLRRSGHGGRDETLHTEPPHLETGTVEEMRHFILSRHTLRRSGHGGRDETLHTEPPHVETVRARWKR